MICDDIPSSKPVAALEHEAWKVIYLAHQELAASHHLNSGNIDSDDLNQVLVPEIVPKVWLMTQKLCCHVPCPAHPSTLENPCIQTGLRLSHKSDTVLDHQERLLRPSNVCQLRVGVLVNLAPTVLMDRIIPRKHLQVRLHHSLCWPPKTNKTVQPLWDERLPACPSLLSKCLKFPKLQLMQLVIFNSCSWWSIKQC